MNIGIVYNDYNSARRLSSGEVTIARKVVARIIEAIGDSRRIALPLDHKKSDGIVHETLPWVENGQYVGHGLDGIDLQDGDPENKMHVLVDRLVARLKHETPTSFRAMPLPGGSLDISVGIVETDTNLWVRMLRGYNIQRNEFDMALTVQTK